VLHDLAPLVAGLGLEDLVLGAGAHVRCEGKGRKELLVPVDLEEGKAQVKGFLRIE